MVYEKTNDEIVPARTGSMQRENAVKCRVDRLTVIKGILAEPEVAADSSGMEAVVWN